MKQITTKDLLPHKVRTLTVFDQRWYDFLFLPGPVTKSFVSTTTLLSAWGDRAFLMNFRGRVGNEEADRRMHEGGHLGTELHRAINCSGQGGYVGLLPKEGDEFDYEGRQEVLRAIEACKMKGHPFYTLETDEQMLLMSRFEDLCYLLDPYSYEGDVTIWTQDCCGQRAWGYAGTLDHIWRLEKREEAKSVAWYDYKGEKMSTPPTGNMVWDWKTGYEKPEDLLQGASYFMGYNTGQRVKLDGSPTSKEVIELDGLVVAYLDSYIRTGIPGVKLVYANKEEVERALFPRFLTVGDNWHIAHPNAKRTREFYRRHVYLPGLAAPTGRIVPSAAAGTLDELNKMLVDSLNKETRKGPGSSEKEQKPVPGPAKAPKPSKPSHKDTPVAAPKETPKSSELFDDGIKKRYGGEK